MLALLATVIFAAMFAGAQHLEGTAAIVPSAIAVFGLCMALLELWRNKVWLKPVRVCISPADLRSQLLQGLWIFGFAIALVGFGVLIAIPCCLIANLRLLGGQTWPKSIFIAFATTTAFFVVFTVLLDYRLPTGLIFESF